MSHWADDLAGGAPDLVGAWRGIDAGRFLEVRRAVRRAGGAGTAPGIATQLAVLAAAMTELLDGLDAADLRRPGGEGDWNVAQAVGHAADSRAGLALAAAKAATGTFPADAPTVVPGIPGAPDADRASLRKRIETSQRIVERAARQVDGHELDPCPLVHPLVGTLRCGEWLVFAGVHDLMHLEQLHGLAEQGTMPS
jgi:hypothetical protein